MGLGWHGASKGLGAPEEKEEQGMTTEQADALISSVQALVSRMDRIADALEEQCWLTVDCEEPGDPTEPTEPDCAIVAEDESYVVDEDGAYVLRACPPEEYGITDEEGTFVVDEFDSYVIEAYAAEITSEDGQTLVDEDGAVVTTEVA